MTAQTKYERAVERIVVVQFPSALFALLKMAQARSKVSQFLGALLQFSDMITIARNEEREGDRDRTSKNSVPGDCDRNTFVARRGDQSLFRPSTFRTC